MAELTVFKIVIVVVCAVFIGITKSAIPGLTILIVPLLAEAMPARASTGFMLLLLIFGNIFAVFYYKRHAEWKYILRLFPWAGAGVVIGFFIMGRIDDKVMKPLIGAVILVMLVIHLIREWILKRKGVVDDGEQKPPANIVLTAFIGLAAGVTTMVANAAGPVMMLYFLAVRIPKKVFIGTTAWFFFVVDLFKLPFSIGLGIVTLPSFLNSLMLIPAVGVGILIGILVAKKVPQKAFDMVIIVLTAGAAVKLFF